MYRLEDLFTTGVAEGSRQIDPSRIFESYIDRKCFTKIANWKALINSLTFVKLANSATTTEEETSGYPRLRVSQKKDFSKIKIDANF